MNVTLQCVLAGNVYSATPCWVSCSKLHTLGALTTSKRACQVVVPEAVDSCM
jgi:hypothetical protein